MLERRQRAAIAILADAVEDDVSWGLGTSSANGFRALRLDGRQGAALVLPVLPVPQIPENQEPIESRIDPDSPPSSDKQCPP
jgi:hypothetical protein